MGYQQSSKFCDRCKKDVLVTRQKVNHILHLLLSIITGGLWVFIWILAALNKSCKLWRCSICGNKVSVGFLNKKIF